MNQRKFNPELIAKLESPERRALFPAETLLSLLDVNGTVSVLDIGAGTGYFAIPAAAQTEGVVYALDVEPSMLEVIESKAEKGNLTNIRTIQGALEHIPLEDGAVDRIIASLVLHETDNLKLAISEIARVLREGGRCLCVEWEKTTTEQHRIHSFQMRQAMEENGLQVLSSVSQSGSHYVMVIQK
ncbi:class I SAM-dependent methyltransferase [Paenibacillus sp. GP183]|jgi:ubiquinone/menaquinone biosynthesis C-methylase UbiE|uniref:class I SAM-dependent methyltransferase n=1 Tax=Paenibacillus sp. GP183 TaxID=1882751 RepID=UPI00089CCE10|nr:class I SAM-dependent methyltransferase [Paenibacillus sp. GP183]SEB88452.1 Methyltransferase domain-containing protein [Paenibacillus sp. GP183]